MSGLHTVKATEQKKDEPTAQTAVKQSEWKSLGMEMVIDSLLCEVHYWQVEMLVRSHGRLRMEKRRENYFG